MANDLYEGIKDLNLGYLLTVVSFVLLITAFLLPIFSLFALIALVASFIYVLRGFSKLSKADPKYAPGKRGLYLMLFAALLSVLAAALPGLASLALSGASAIVGIFATYEYLKGLWELSKLKGGEPIRYGVIASALAAASGLVANTLIYKGALRGAGASVVLYALPTFFFAILANTLFYLGTKNLLASLKG